MKEVRNKRTHTVFFHEYEMFRISISIETEGRFLVATGGRRGDRGVTANGHGTYFGVDGMF